jgi:DNA-binding LacI/PurR family transcriptional regulator
MPTLSDVAKVCNVSPMTVSCVLNNKPGRVSAATRERVLRAVRDLNYHPNAIARGLTGQRLNTLGVVHLQSHDPIHTAGSFVLMLDGVLDMATRLRQDTLICTSYSWQDGINNVSPLLDGRCDGLIIMVPRQDLPLIPLLQENGIPFVLLCAKSKDPRVSTVDTDNAGAVCQAVHRLIERGHRRIAFQYYEHEEAYGYCVERLEGYRRAHREAGLDCVPERVKNCPPEMAVEELMRLPNDLRPTALFCVTDVLAMKAIAHLEGRGLRVPDDLSVVGYDGIREGAENRPSLTTVRQPLKEIGQKCVEVLLAQIRGEAAPGQKILLPTEIIERGSSAPPPNAR